MALVSIYFMFNVLYINIDNILSNVIRRYAAVCTLMNLISVYRPTFTGLPHKYSIECYMALCRRLYLTMNLIYSVYRPTFTGLPHKNARLVGPII